MKNNISIFSLVLAFALFAGCKSNEPEHNMSSMNADAVDPSLSVVVRPTNEIVISSQTIVKPGTSASAFDITANGFITIDPRRNNKVAVRFDGRVEKLYTKYNYQYVNKGQAIMDLYSPELVTIEEEYLYLLKDKQDTSIIRQTKTKLLLLGITEEQIRKLTEKGETTATITLFSPYDGYIILDNVQSAMIGDEINENTVQQNAGMKGMNENQNNISATVTAGKILEGSYVTKGQTLFIINDLKNVWAILSIKGNNQVTLNSPVRISSDQLGTDSVASTISFIEPTYSKGQKFTSCRVNLDNSNRDFSINTIVTARVSSTGPTIMQVPVSSILFLGQRKIVWVKTGVTPGGHSIFERRDVTSSGFQNGQYIEITSGIKSTDELAKDAGLLIDSQSLIQ